MGSPIVPLTNPPDLLNRNRGFSFVFCLAVGFQFILISFSFSFTASIHFYFSGNIALRGAKIAKITSLHSPDYNVKIRNDFLTFDPVRYR